MSDVSTSLTTLPIGWRMLSNTQSAAPVSWARIATPVPTIAAVITVVPEAMAMAPAPAPMSPAAIMAGGIYALQNFVRGSFPMATYAR